MTAYELALLVLRSDIKGSAQVKLVAAVLATFVNNKTGLAYPAVSTLAALSGAHERTVRRCLADLKAQGLIVESQHGRRCGRGQTTRWRFNLDRLMLSHGVGHPGGKGDAGVTLSVDNPTGKHDAGVTLSVDNSEPGRKSLTSDAQKGDAGVTQTIEGTSIQGADVEKSTGAGSRGVDENRLQEGESARERYRRFRLSGALPPEGEGGAAAVGRDGIEAVVSGPRVLSALAVARQQIAHGGGVGAAVGLRPVADAVAMAVAPGGVRR